MQSLNDYYANTINYLEFAHATGSDWNNFNVSDSGIVILENICFLLNDLEYKINHPIVNLLNNLASVRDKILRVKGVIYCTFNLSGSCENKLLGAEIDYLDVTAHNPYKGLCEIDIKIIMQSGFDRNDINRNVEVVLAGIDELRVNHIDYVYSRSLLAKRREKNKLLPFYSPEEIYCTYPETTRDFRKVLIDVKGVHNAWLYPTQFDGVFDVDISISDEPKNKTTLKSIIENRLESLRPLGAMFRHINFLQELAVEIHVIVDIGQERTHCNEEFALQLVKHCSEIIAGKIEFRSLKEIEETKWNECLNSPELDYGFLTEQELDENAIKDTINGFDIKSKLDDLVEGCLVKRIFISSDTLSGEKHDKTSFSIAFDKRKFSPRLERYKIDFCDEQELIESFYGENNNLKQPTRKSHSSTAITLSEYSGLNEVSSKEVNSIGRYEGLFELLPEVFNARAHNQHMDLAESDRINAAQLRSYLSVFDLVFKSYHKSLESLPDLFNLYSNIHYQSDIPTVYDLIKISHIQIKNISKFGVLNDLPEQERRIVMQFLLGSIELDIENSNIAIPPEIDLISDIDLIDTKIQIRNNVKNWLLDKHKDIDMFLRFLGYRTSEMAVRATYNIGKLLRLFQIKKNFLALCYSSRGFHNLLYKIEESKTFHGEVAVVNYAIDHLVKRLQLHFECIYLRNDISYQDGQNFFYLIDHIALHKQQYKNNLPSSNLALTDESGITCILPSDPGEIYLTGLIFEEKGLAYAESFQWPPADIEKHGELTIEAMVYVPSNIPGVQSLLSIGGKAGNNRLQIHLADIDGWMHFDYGDGSNRVSCDFKPFMNRWAQVAVVVDHGKTGSISIFIDGKHVKTDRRIGHPALILQGLSLGEWLAGPKTRYGFVGRVADLRIWSKAKTEEEITSDRCKAFDANAEALEAYYPLGKGNCEDFSGNGHKLKLSSEPYFADTPPERLDTDDDKEDEFESIYDQVHKKLVNELPAHLHVNIFQVSDRLFQWFGDYFSSPFNLLPSKKDKVRHFIKYLETHCKDKDIITFDRVGDLMVYSSIAQWVESFQQYTDLKVELIEEPDYSKANKSAKVKIHFQNSLLEWSLRHQSLLTDTVSRGTNSTELLRLWSIFVIENDKRGEIPLEVERDLGNDDGTEDKLVSISYMLKIQSRF